MRNKAREKKGREEKGRGDESRTTEGRKAMIFRGWKTGGEESRKRKGNRRKDEEQKAQGHLNYCLTSHLGDQGFHVF